MGGHASPRGIRGWVRRHPIVTSLYVIFVVLAVPITLLGENHDPLLTIVKNNAMLAGSLFLMVWGFVWVQEHRTPADQLERLRQGEAQAPAPDPQAPDGPPA